MVQSFENLKGFDADKSWLVVLYRHDEEDHTVLYSIAHCNDKRVFIEPARTTFTYQAERLIKDLTTSVNVTNDANTGERLGINNAVQTNEWCHGTVRVEFI